MILYLIQFELTEHKIFSNYMLDLSFIMVTGMVSVENLPVIKLPEDIFLGPPLYSFSILYILAAQTWSSCIVFQFSNRTFQLSLWNNSIRETIQFILNESHPGCGSPDCNSHSLHMNENQGFLKRYHRKT